MRRLRTSTPTSLQQVDFDRLIAAAARRRRWTVVTVDESFAALEVGVLDPSLG